MSGRENRSSKGGEGKWMLFTGEWRRREVIIEKFLRLGIICLEFLEFFCLPGT